MPVAAAQNASKHALGTLRLPAIALESTVSMWPRCFRHRVSTKRTYSKLASPADRTYILTFRSHRPETPNRASPQLQVTVGSRPRLFLISGTVNGSLFAGHCMADQRRSMDRLSLDQLAKRSIRKASSPRLLDTSIEPYYRVQSCFTALTVEWGIP